MQSLFECAAKREYGVREKHIRQGAMRYTAARRRNHRHVVIINKGAVGQDRLVRQQAEILQGSGITHPAATLHMRVFPVVFRTMGLHMGTGCRRQITKSAQGRIGTGGDKARCDHWHNLTVVSRHG